MFDARCNARCRRAGMARALSVAGAMLGCATAAAHAELQWQCTPGEDGGWVCEEVEMDAGPFPPAPTAPVFQQPRARGLSRGAPEPDPTPEPEPDSGEQPGPGPGPRPDPTPGPGPGPAPGPGPGPAPGPGPGPAPGPGPGPGAAPGPAPTPGSGRPPTSGIAPLSGADGNAAQRRHAGRVGTPGRSAHAARYAAVPSPSRPSRKRGAGTPAAASSDRGGEDADDAGAADAPESIRVAPTRRPGQTEEQARLDWVPRRALASEDRREIPPWCGGAYVEPEWDAPLSGGGSGGGAVELVAGSVDYRQGAEAHLDGGVRLRRASNLAEADRATLEERQQRVTLEGDVELRETGMLLRGERATIDLGQNSARVEDAEFVLHGSGHRGGAERIARSADGTLAVREGHVTRCQPGNDSWRVVSRRLEVDEASQKATARDARLEIGGVPVLWVPWLRFPVGDERRSGLLFPGLGFSGDDGVDIAVPYYFNLAPNYDATLTPRFISDRGFMMEGEVRYLSPRSENRFAGAFLPEDDRFDGRFSRREYREEVAAGLLPPERFDPEDRWLLAVEHSGRWRRGLKTSVDFVGVSDDDYFRDLGTDLGLDVRDEVERSGSVSWRRDGLAVRLWAQDFQVLEPNVSESFRRVPQLDFAWRRQRVAGVPLEAELAGHYARFERDDLDVPPEERVEGTRLHAVPRLTVPLEWPFAWLRSSVSWHYTRYALDESGAGSTALVGRDDEPDRTLPIASLDAGLRFERALRLGGEDFVQTLEPRIHYLFVEDENQDDLPLFDTTPLTFSAEQFFRENRFAGVDRIGDANRISTVVTTRLRGASGREHARLTAGRITHFEDRGVTLEEAEVDPTDSASPWLAELAVRLTDAFSARGLLLWDGDDRRTEQSRLDLRWHPGDGRLLNFAFRRRIGNIEQTDLSGRWPVTDRIALVARWFYDLERDETVETFVGLEYDDCCWRVRLIGRRQEEPFDGVRSSGTENETGVFLEVALKGLAGFGDTVDSILESGIRGYRERDTDGIAL